MKTLILKNANAILPNEPEVIVSILIENGIIAEISENIAEHGETIDLDGGKVFAGFIDIHNHGAIGFDVN